jgi:hypothetical protein
MTKRVQSDQMSMQQWGLPKIKTFICDLGYYSFDLFLSFRRAARLQIPS